MKHWGWGGGLWWPLANLHSPDDNFVTLVPVNYFMSENCDFFCSFSGNPKFTPHHFYTKHLSLINHSHCSVGLALLTRNQLSRHNVKQLHMEDGLPEVPGKLVVNI